MRILPPMVAARSLADRSALRRCFYGLILALGAPALGGCLAFKDFEVLDENSGPNGGSDSGVECTGQFECIGHVLYSCQNGNREELEDCEATARWCNAELGACTECRVGTPPACEGNVLRLCGALGQYEPGRDCGAEGLYCSPARSHCVPCIAGRTYCAPRGPDDEYDQRFTCGDFEIPPNTVDCFLGCLPTGNGEGDCAKCATAGELYCDGDDVLRCPEDRTQRPSIEQECPYNCDPDAPTAECLPAPP